MESAILLASRSTPRPQADGRIVRPTKRFALGHGRTRSFVGRRGETVVRCEAGRLWLTQAGDDRDVVLERGQRHTCRRTGRIVLEGLGESVAAVSEGEIR